MLFNKEEYLAQFKTLQSLINERNLIHQIYYLDSDKMFTREQKKIARDKLHALSEKFVELRTNLANDNNIEEWNNAWGKCPCGKGKW